MESNGFCDLDHCFGVDHPRQKVKPLFNFQTEIFGTKLMNWMAITLILGFVIGNTVGLPGINFHQSILNV